MCNASSIDQTKVKSAKQSKYKQVFQLSSDNYNIYGFDLIAIMVCPLSAAIFEHILWYCLPSDSLINRIYGGCEALLDIFELCGGAP